MLIRTELHNETRIRSIYKIDNLNNRESALRWAVNASKVLPFEGLTIHIEDGDSYHDGTISTVVAEIDNIDSFVNKYLKTPIYVVCIRGNYKGAHISVQIHLDLQKIYIGCEVNERHLLLELEQILDLV